MIAPQGPIPYFFYSGVTRTFATIHKDILFPGMSMKVTVNLCNKNLSQFEFKHLWTKSSTVTHSRWLVMGCEPLKKALCMIDCGVYGRVRLDPLPV